MPITALPESTIRLLGSHAVIATPVDLFKELLDNSIDAKATSVDILVSSNIVDKIEVRDNGQGIHPLDYASLGRAGHTSKITAFEDLQTLGGTTLGFRGQALASINSLGTVTVTTRTAEDILATELTLSSGYGGVQSQRQTSAPVGTTVSVVGLYSELPVRKRAATKDALKNLVKVKQLLQAYALARPNIRLSLRTTGGGNRQTFSYSPRPEAGVKEAVVQIFGIEVAAQCLISTVCNSPGDESDENMERNEGFSVEAVLPRKDADQSRLAKGSFFSVDSRPVSAQRGTMKKILAIFKACLSAYLQTIYGERAFRDSFICVNIKCLAGSYDPNIEPSKHVVLFADDSQLIKLFEQLCTEVYCKTEDHDPFITIRKRRLLTGAQARTPPQSSDSPTCEETTAGVIEEVSQNRVNPSTKTPPAIRLSPRCGPVEESRALRKPAPTRVASKGFTFDMSADPDISSDEEAEIIAAHFRQNDHNHRVEEGGEDSMQTLNPWIIAKMNAPVRQANNITPSLAGQPQNSFQIQEQSEFASQGETFDNLPILRPCPAAPADLDFARTARHGVMPTSLQQTAGELPGFRDAFGIGKVASAASRDISKPALQTSLANSVESPPPSRFPTAMRTATDLHTSSTGVVGADGLVQTNLGLGRRSDSLQTTRKGRVQRHINDMPSKINPPFRRPKRVITRNKQPSISNQGHTDRHVAARIDKNHLINEALDPMRSHGTLRITAPAQSCSNMTGSDTHQPRAPDGEGWKDGDTRKYLMKRQLSEAEHRRKGRQPLKRVKTDRLPLENVPQCQGTQHLVLPVEIDAMKFSNDLDFMAKFDDNLTDSRPGIESIEEMNLDDVVEVEARLKSLLDNWTEKVLGEKSEVDFDLRSQVKGKMVAV